MNRSPVLFAMAQEICSPNFAIVPRVDLQHSGHGPVSVSQGLVLDED